MVEHHEVTAPEVRASPGFRVRLTLITAAAFAGRVAYVLIARRNTKVWGDAVSYHVGANLLAAGKGFIDPLRYELAGMRVPSAYHPPLYTVYLAVWSKLGLQTPLEHRLVSCALGAATVAVVGLAARRLAGERVGLLAALLAAVYAHLWLNDGSLLSETAAAFAVAWVLLAIVRFRARPSVPRAAVVGVATAAATLGRAELALLLPFAALPLVLGAGTLPLRERFVRLGALAAAGLVVLGPWVGYNLVRFEDRELVSTGLGATMASGACEPAYHGRLLGYWAACGIPQVNIPPPDPGTAARWSADPNGTRLERQAYFRRYLAGRPDESVEDHRARTQALDYIRAHRGRTVVVVLARVGRIWNVFRPLQNARLDGTIEGRGLGPARVALVMYFVYMLAAIAGCVALRRRRVAVWPFLVLAGIVTFSAALTFGIQRYRVPVDVALPILAAVGVDALWTSWRGARGTPMTPPHQADDGSGPSPVPETVTTSS